MTAAIIVEGLERSFGETKALAGLDMAVTPNVSVPQGGLLDWALVDRDQEGPPPAANGGTEEPSDGVRVRQYFPETWVWEPLLLTDEEGRALLDGFNFPFK